MLAQDAVDIEVNVKGRATIVSAMLRNNTIKLSLLGAVLLNIFLLPVNVSVTPAVATAYDPNDPDPVHRMQTLELIRAVEEGRDTDPVHIAEARAAKAVLFPEMQSAPTPEAVPTPAAAPNTQAAQPQSAVQELAPVQTPAAPAPVQNTGALYVDPASNAARQAREWQHWPEGARQMATLAAEPTAKWFGGWSGNVEEAARQYVSAASAAGKTAVLVAYNVPERDCGGYSAGGTSNYTEWIGALARGIGGAKAIVILEPDGLSQMDCLSQSGRDARYQLLSGAVSILKSNSNTAVYIDAGHSGWHSPEVMAARLQKANLYRADGFALNVSNFRTTSDETSYGSQISSFVGGKHFVVDTSRNGNGSNGEWCNPWGRAIGQKPTLQTGNGLVDAYLWVKTPGESDGTCNGGPSAGVWWPDYARSLVR